MTKFGGQFALASHLLQILGVIIPVYPRDLRPSHVTRYIRPWHIPVTSCNNISPEAQIAVNLLPVLLKLRSLQLVLRPRDLKNYNCTFSVS